MTIIDWIIGLGLLYVMLGLILTQLAHLIIDISEPQRKHYWPWEDGFWTEMRRDAAWGFGWPVKVAYRLIDKYRNMT